MFVNVWVMYKEVTGRKPKCFDFFLHVVDDLASSFQMVRLTRDKDQNIMKLSVKKTEISHLQAINEVSTK